MVRGAISFEARPLWLSFEAHLQHIGTSTAFWELFCYRSFCSTLALFFSKIMPKPHTTRVAMSCLTAYQTLPWPPARSLSNQACLGYDGKETASTREC
ncbi:hypothetical protein TNCV_2965071 [Trichonephila clavipes]|nr:hypothetical protein TNCV_2965071 [Trichonephila clavipes]